MHQEPITSSRFTAAIGQLTKDLDNKKEVLCFGSHCISVPSFVAACSKEQPGDFASHHCASCDLDSVLACLSGRSDDIVELVAVDSGAAKSFVNKQGASLLSGGLAQSDVKAVGINGTIQKADGKGRLLVTLRDVKTGNLYELDLGLAHVLSDSPVNLLSISQTLPAGLIFHFERNKNYVELPSGERIELIQANGLFYLPLQKSSGASALPPSTTEAEAYGAVPGLLAEAAADEEEQDDEHVPQTDEFWRLYCDIEIPTTHHYQHQTPLFAYETRAALTEAGVPALAMTAFETWHRRLRHISPEHLRRLHQKGFVLGLDIDGNRSERNCNCNVCRLVKSRVKGLQKGAHREPINHAGERVSTDLKFLPLVCFEGIRYIVPFIDHYSKHTYVYFSQNKKAETIALIMKQYISDMEVLGVKVKKITSDRGSEFYSQDKATLADNDKWTQQVEHIFNKACSDLGVQHVAQPVGDHEVLAESWFSRHSVAVDAMLAQARLSGIFAPFAYAYSCWIENRMPCVAKGRLMSPHEIITGEVPDFSFVKVFGCDAYVHIPHNKDAKMPGVARAQKMLFMGFHKGRKGAALFDPVERKLVTGSTNVTFHENMDDRIDALRHYDRRAAQLKKGVRMERQELQSNDFEIVASDPTSSSAVRRLFTSTPDDPETLSDVLEEENRAHEAGEFVDDPTEDNEGQGAVVQPGGDVDRPATSPLHPITSAARQARKAFDEVENMRPVRTVRVGKLASYSPEDSRFLKRARTLGTKCVFLQPCPKKKVSKSRTRYLRYMAADTLSEAVELGALEADITHDYRKGFITFPTCEPDVEGHVHDALALCAEHGVEHCLDRYGLYCSNAARSDFVLAGLVEDPERRDWLFNDMVKNAFKPDRLPKELETVFASTRFSEKCAKRILDLNSMKLACPGLVTDDSTARAWSLEPEPTTPEMALSESNLEREQWAASMDEEIQSMREFGVFKAARWDAAKKAGKQVVTCRWLYRRKVGPDGRVSRYRSRLVAQGYLQRPGDSYQPDEIHSPVVSKDGLRMFLSLACGHDMLVRQLDIQAAFLQADLAEEIYVKPPLGFEKFLERPDDLLRVSRGLYGLKQGSSSFWTALKTYLCGPVDRSRERWNKEMKSCSDAAAYLNGNPELEAVQTSATADEEEACEEKLMHLGFKSITSDPCIFVRNDHRGKIIVCTYVDDLTYACTSDALAEEFLSDMRKRFTIPEGEGKPAAWLLSMKVEQQLKEGTLKISQETYIELLCDKFLTEEEKQRGVNVRHPMLHSTPLAKNDSGTSVPKTEFDYLSCVGSLLHCSNCTRPDVACAVGILARFAAAPSHAHCQAARRVCLYLYNTKTLGLTYRRDASTMRNAPIVLEGAVHPLDPNKEKEFTIFADSAYADSHTRRSTFGNVTFMNGAPISWQSTLAKTVALSTAEAEINAAVEATKLALHLRLMLSEITGDPLRDILIGEDNQAAVSQATKGIRYVRNAKHYECRLRWLQEVAESGHVRFTYVASHDQAADPMTKPLDEVNFTRFRHMLVS